VAFFDLTAAEVARQVRDREVTATEMATRALEAIEAAQRRGERVRRARRERSLEQAGAVDALIASGADPGPLAGVPIGVKDLEDAAGFPTTHGSPLEADATASVARLAPRRPAPSRGMCGRRQDEHARVRLDGRARPTPSSASRATPGTSSTPRAAPREVGRRAGRGHGAARDGVRRRRVDPHPLCALRPLGLKALLRRVPVGGPTPPGWLSLSAKGPMARRIADVALALDAVVGPEQDDLGSLPRPEASWLDAVVDPKLPTVVGWSADARVRTRRCEVRRVCERALSALEGLGVEVVELPNVFEATPSARGSTSSRPATRATSPRCASTPATASSTPSFAGPRTTARPSRGPARGGPRRVPRLNLRLVELFHSVRLLLTPTTAALAPHERDGIAGIVNGEPDVAWSASPTRST